MLLKSIKNIILTISFVISSVNASEIANVINKISLSQKGDIELRTKTSAESLDSILAKNKLNQFQIQKIEVLSEKVKDLTLQDGLND